MNLAAPAWTPLPRNRSVSEEEICFLILCGKYIAIVLVDQYKLRRYLTQPSNLQTMANNETDDGNEYNVLLDILFAEFPFVQDLVRSLTLVLSPAEQFDQENRSLRQPPTRALHAH